jgi:hypothetical protein
MRFKRVTLVAGGGRYRKTQCPQTPRSASGASLILESRRVPWIDASRTHEQRERGGGKQNGVGVRRCLPEDPADTRRDKSHRRLLFLFSCLFLVVLDRVELPGKGRGERGVDVVAAVWCCVTRCGLRRLKALSAGLPRVTSEPCSSPWSSRSRAGTCSSCGSRGSSQGRAPGPGRGRGLPWRRRWCGCCSPTAR